jgi:hypothetical protein
VCVLLVALGLSGRATAECVRIKVDVRAGYVINGKAEIQPLMFGVTAYEGAPMLADPDAQKVLQEAGITCVGFPGVIGWCAPPERPKDGIKGIEAWYSSDEAKRLMTDERLTDRYLYGHILPGCREAGIEPMIYLLGGPAWAMESTCLPKDVELYPKMISEYVRLLQKFDPKLRLMHYENEPNSHLWQIGKSGKDYADWYKRVACELRDEYLNVLIGGPVTCWPPAWPPPLKHNMAWNTWDEYTLPLLDTGRGLVDFVDFHAYGMSELLDTPEEITLVANEMWLRWGGRVPCIISEAGIGMTEAEWKSPELHWDKRTVPWVRFLMTMIDQPDKVSSVQMHDLMAIAGEWFRLLDDNWRDPDKRCPTYWAYWIMRHMRGNRLFVEQEPGGGLKVIATRDQSTSEAAVFLFNDSDKSREVAIDFAGASGAAKWERLFVTRRADSSVLVRDSGSGAKVVMPARSFAAVFAPVAKGTPLKAVRERREFFGGKVMCEFSQKTGEIIKIPVSVPAEALKGAIQATVRVGILGNTEEGLVNHVSLLAGGKTYQLRNGSSFQEFRLPALPKPGITTLGFRLDDRSSYYHPLRISCATIVLERKL